MLTDLTLVLHFLLPTQDFLPETHQMRSCYNEHEDKLAELKTLKSERARELVMAAEAKVVALYNELQMSGDEMSTGLAEVQNQFLPSIFP